MYMQLIFQFSEIIVILLARLELGKTIHIEI